MSPAARNARSGQDCDWTETQQHDLRLNVLDVSQVASKNHSIELCKMKDLFAPYEIQLKS